MADGPKQPSLTVLSGPKAGTEFLIGDVADNLFIGSGRDCSFCIEAEGVSPIHARLWVDLEGLTVYETGSPQGVFVNDDRVNEQATLRNGDILWLGLPGGELSTMLQVRIPPRPAKAPAPPEPEEDSGATQAFRSPFAAGGPFALGVMAESPADHSETVAMPRPDIALPAVIQEAEVVDPDETVGLRSRRPPSDREETEAPESSHAAVIDASDFEVHDVETPEVEAIPEEAGIEAEPEESPLGEGARPEPSSYDPDSDPDSTRALGRVSVEPEPEPEPEAEPEPTLAFTPEASPAPEPEPEPTVALPYNDTDPLKFDVDLPPALSLPPPEEHAFEEDIDETVMMAHAHEVETVITPPTPAPPEAEQEEIGETVVMAHADEMETAVIEPPKAAAVPLAAPPEARPTPPRVPEPEPTVVVPAAPPPGRPSLRKELRSEAPAAAPRPPAAPPRAEPAARPSVRPVPASPPVVPPAAPKAAPASAGRGVAIGLGLLVLAAVGVGAFLLLRPKASPVTPPPSSLAEATPAPPQVSLTPAPTEQPTAEPLPEPTPPVEEEVTVVPGATPRPRPSPTPTLSPSPRTAAVSPAAPTRPTLPTQPVTTAPPQQASVAVRVAGLMAQAQTAASGGNYDAAVAQYDEVLKLDPQNATAQAARMTAISSRAAARKSFVTGRTVVQAGKAKANLSGFDTADVSVQKAPDFSGRLEFSMSPPRPRPGESYTLQIALVNDGKKSIKVSGLSVTTVVNGARSGGPMAPRVREIAPQQRAVLEALPGVWPPDVNSWTTEVQVSAGKEESLRGQVSWR